MRCPNCQNEESKVVDSRITQNGKSVRRRRECLKCNFRYTTYEYVLQSPIVVVKKTGAREEYNRQKLQSSFHIACNKRPVSEEMINKSIDGIEEMISNLSNVEVSSSEIGEMVMSALKELDNVAFVRFASVYREFKELDDLQSQIEDLTDE